jgi:hypothetical protein
VSALERAPESVRRGRGPRLGGRLAWLGWIVVAGLLGLSFVLQRSMPARARPRGFAESLLGPFAALAASLEWIRADAALRAGDYPLAYARAETALELEPGRADAWIFLAHHFIFERASLSRAVDREERRAWVQAGLDVLERGLRVSDDPGEIQVYRGGVFVALASIPDDDRPWPGSAREAWLDAAESFDRAAAAGHENAAQFAAAARAHASAPAGDRAPPFRPVPDTR